MADTSNIFSYGWYSARLSRSSQGRMAIDQLVRHSEAYWPIQSGGTSCLQGERQTLCNCLQRACIPSCTRRCSCNRNMLLPLMLLSPVSKEELVKRKLFLQSTVKIALPLMLAGRLQRQTHFFQFLYSQIDLKNARNKQVDLAGQKIQMLLYFIYKVLSMGKTSFSRLWIHFGQLCLS